MEQEMEDQMDTAASPWFARTRVYERGLLIPSIHESKRLLRGILGVLTLNPTH